jgi:DNA-binding response OmpR family regulator
MSTDETLRQRHGYVFMTTDPRRAVDDCGETLEELEAPLLPKPFHIDELVEAVHAAEQRLASLVARPGDGPD